jgi:CysZ protein
MFKHLSLALTQTLSPPMRAILWKVIGLTLLTLFLIGMGLHRVAGSFLTLVKWPWVQGALDILAGLGLFFGALFLIGSASAIIAGFFGDEIAQSVEAKHYAQDKQGVGMPLATSVLEGVKISLIALAINFIALLFFFTGIGVFMLFFANAYLLSREYFELAAMRHHSPQEAKALRRAQKGKVLFYGLPIAGLMLIPFVNLLTPVFGIALMVHCYKSVSKSSLSPTQKVSV